MTKSRLQRILDKVLGVGTQLFIFRADTDSFSHSNTQSITITRGSSSRLTGHTPATVEATVLGRYDSFPTGSQTRVYLRDGEVEKLAAYLGVSAASIRDRYYGRTSMVTIDDRGRDASTSFTGTSWLTQLNFSPRHVTPRAAEPIAQLLGRMTFMDSPIRGTELITRVGGAALVHHLAGEQMLFKDAIGKLAGEIGIPLHEQRDGTTIAWGHQYREIWAASNMSSHWPIMRHQAIAPATYQQLGERPPSPVDFTLINPTGGTAVRSIEPPNPTGETVSREEIDWSRWRVGTDDNQLWREAWCKAYETSPGLYSIPDITIDMLMLLRQGTEYTKKIAGQILKLEAGEPVYLAGDWPTRLRGVHYAEGIKETIGPSEWRFDLSLIPHALGAGTPTPTVPNIAWDSFMNAWDTETRNWN